MISTLLQAVRNGSCWPVGKRDPASGILLVSEPPSGRFCCRVAPGQSLQAAVETVK